MKKTLQLTLLLATAIFANAQTSPEKFAATITGADLKKQLTIIASAEMEGRETGTEGQRKAAAYIESQFKQFGLLASAALKGYQQYYPLSKDSITESSLTVNGQTYLLGKDYIAAAQSNQAKKLTSKKIIFAGYGIEDAKYNDLTSKKIKGNVIVFFGGEPKQNGNYTITGNNKPSDWSSAAGQSKKLLNAKAKGAALVLMINQAADTFNTRAVQMLSRTNMYSVGNNNEKASAVTINHAMAKNILGEENFNRLLAKAKNFEPLDTENIAAIKAKTAFTYAEKSESGQSSNVIGYIEGTDKKDEYIILTGHYDHLGKKGDVIYYGADDDGSGTCGVLEMAQAFAAAKAAGNGPRRTVIFMTVSGEEKGLWGSEFYGDNPVFPLQKTSVDLNTDMVGRIDTERKTDDSLNYVYVVGHDKLSSELPGINEGMNKKYTNLVLDYKYDDPNDKNRIYFRSDHYNFAKKGVPVLFFYDGMLKADYHKPTDTVDKINFELYEKRVRMIFYTAWEMANRDEMLKRDIPLQ